jgi:RNase H-fold protein (predicted Holliday junction resolvase)
MTIILGFDPGRDKCGVAVRNRDRAIVYHQVIESKEAISTINNLCQQYQVELIVMGDKTTAKSWFDKLKTNLNTNVSIEMVDEDNSTLEARDRYWQMYPATGLTRLIPQSLRVPPRPVDDIVAILLIERYLSIEQ